jgi:type III pantothenate kinase
MLLAIDVGNTNIHFGLIRDDGVLCCSWRARTIRDKMSDEYAVLLRSFFEEKGFTFQHVRAVVMACVVPDLTGTFTALAERYLGHKPLNVNHTVSLGLQIKVDNPREVGPDRIVNAAAAKSQFGGPAIVIDFGTATTYDVINADGDYIGGVIAPGITLAQEALVSRAARLLHVELEPPPRAIGSNTIQAMQSGLFLGYTSMIEGLVGRIRAELQAPQAAVIGTGGLAPVFAEHTELIAHIAPNLTLDGLRIIWALNV